MTESLVDIRVDFHKETKREVRRSIIYSLLIEFYDIFEWYEWFSSDPKNGNVCLTLKETMCECQKSAFGWDLILFFADRWQEVKNVEIEFDGKKVKIFPLDVGTCS